MTARLSLIVKTSSAMGFAHYSTAGKSGRQAGAVFLAVPYRSVVFTIRSVQINARLRPPLLGRPLRSRLIRSGRRLAERNALPAYACGNARRRVLSLGEDATPAMLSAEPSEPLRSRPSSRLQASPPRHPPRRQSGLQAVPTRGSPQGRQDSVRQAGHRPAVPKQKIAAYAVNPLPAASSLTAHSPPLPHNSITDSLK